MNGRTLISMLTRMLSWVTWVLNVSALAGRLAGAAASAKMSAAASTG